MLITTNLKMAVQSIKATKWRSFLTMLGIIIGVVSVVTIVSLGEGVKREIEDQIRYFGSDVITVRPGKLINRSQDGQVRDVNLFAALNGGSLSDTDLAVIQKTPGVQLAVPVSTVSAVARLDNRELTNGFIFGTTEGMSDILRDKVKYGAFFGQADMDRNFAIIGKDVAEQLFQENVPLGRVMQIRDQTFIVGGVFEEFPANPLTPNLDYNAAVFVPLGVATQLNGGHTQIQQVFVKPADETQVDATATALNSALLQAHAGQRDFTVLRQSDNLAVANKILDLLTGLISGIAAISLIVGGIGIMNIMLVSVSERTHEIGIRKAVGATNRQILLQFLVEGAMISLVGAVIGVVAAYAINYLMRLFTALEPVITWQIVAVAMGVSLVVGVFFAIAPAMRAARKDPIEALRQM